MAEAEQLTSMDCVDGGFDLKGSGPGFENEYGPAADGANGFDFDFESDGMGGRVDHDEAHWDWDFDELPQSVAGSEYDGDGGASAAEHAEHAEHAESAQPLASHAGSDDEGGGFDYDYDVHGEGGAAPGVIADHPGAELADRPAEAADYPDVELAQPLAKDVQPRAAHADSDAEDGDLAFDFDVDCHAAPAAANGLISREMRPTEGLDAWHAKTLRPDRNQKTARILQHADVVLATQTRCTCNEVCCKSRFVVAHLSGASTSQVSAATPLVDLFLQKRQTLAQWNQKEEGENCFNELKAFFCPHTKAFNFALDGIAVCKSVYIAAWGYCESSVNRRMRQIKEGKQHAYNPQGMTKALGSTRGTTFDNTCGIKGAISTLVRTTPPGV
jgi:hypothetical protein